MLVGHHLVATKVILSPNSCSITEPMRVELHLKNAVALEQSARYTVSASVRRMGMHSTSCSCRISACSPHWHFRTAHSLSSIVRTRDGFFHLGPQKLTFLPSMPDRWSWFSLLYLMQKVRPMHSFWFAVCFPDTGDDGGCDYTRFAKFTRCTRAHVDERGRAQRASYVSDFGCGRLDIRANPDGYKPIRQRRRP